MENNEEKKFIDNGNEKPISPNTIKRKINFSCEPNKMIILSLIIITSIQFFIIFILLSKKPKTDNNENKIKGRLFLYKEDNNTNEINKEKIHIAMSIDKNGIYISLVSMVSALENNNQNKNILIYHLLLSHDFNMEKIEYFESLKEKYDFRINYYNISNIFNKYKKWRYSSTIYFKLLIPLIFPDYERIIFLDADTLIFKDISEMFNLPFNDNYVLGYPFHTPWMVTINGKHPKIYINSGVLLININKIRKDYKDIELIQFTLKNSEKLFFPEQDGMNYIFHEKIGLLPLKYGIYLYGNITEYQKEYSYKLNIKLDLKELEKAIEDPSIVHLCCCNPKVWYNSTKHENHFHHICKRFQNEFYFYANKTKFYDTIYNNYMK